MKQDVQHVLICQFDLLSEIVEDLHDSRRPTTSREALHARQVHVHDTCVEARRPVKGNLREYLR